MGEEVLGVIKVLRPAFARLIYETLFFTPDRTIVARLGGGKGGVIGGLLGGAVGGAIGGVLEQREAKKKAEQYSEVSLESILKADKNNYAILNSEVTEVELKKYGKVAKINIKTTTKHGKAMYGETKWQTMEAWKDVGEKYENMLRTIFKDKLIAKK